MEAEEFKRAIKTLGYTQDSFSRHIGVSRRMVGYWCAGTWPVPLVVQRLLGYMPK